MASTVQKKTSLDDLAIEERLLGALRKRRGRATLGDLVVDTGLPAADAERGLKVLLRERQSHLEVDESGELLYLFEPSLQRRGQGDGLRRTLRTLGRWGWKAFKLAFKITIMVTLVVYFILFVVLIIAAFVAMASQRSDSSSSSSSSRRGGGLPIFWITQMFYVSPEPAYVGRGRGSFAAPAEKKEPLYKRIFAYVFGPEANDDDPTDPLLKEREILAFIRSRRGLITLAELIGFTGWERPMAEQQLTRLMGAYDGDVRVTPQGTLLYTFEKVAISAGAEATTRPDLRPAWERPEPPKELTGNGTGTNVVITLINAFNLLAALIAPFFIMPQLGLEGPLWYGALSAFPLLFSLVFFAVPLLRVPWVWLENGRRGARNGWRLLLGEIYRRTERAEDVFEAEVVRAVQRSWSKEEVGGRPDEPRERAAFQRAVRDLSPEIQSTPSGEVYYQFRDLRREQEEGERARGLIDPEQLRLGKIVFSSADPDLGLDQLDDFDRQLAPREVSSRRLEQLDPALGGFHPEEAPVVDEAAAAALDDFERRLLAEAEVEAEVPQRKR